MTIGRPSATLLLTGGGAPRVGGALTMAQAAAARVRVDLSVDEVHDRIEVLLWRESLLAGAEPGATLAVALGDGDDDSDVQDVLTAEVAGVDVQPGAAVLTAFAPSRRLSATFVGRGYVDTPVADVVADLLSEAGVEAGDLDAPTRLPAFHADPRRSAWSVVHSLARRTGRQVTSTPEGAVSFGPVPGGAGGGLGGALASAAAALLGGGDDLREGAELLAFRSGPRAAPAAPPVVTPSGGSGQRWHLWSAEPDDGTTVTVVDPALRSREAADGHADALAAAAARSALRARATVPGRASLRAGATASLRGEQVRILHARHVVDATHGHRCELRCEGVG
jgi:hypothetical protein